MASQVARFDTALATETLAFSFVFCSQQKMKLYESDSRFHSDLGRYYASNLQLPELQPHNVDRNYGVALWGGLSEAIDLKAPGQRENLQMGKIPNYGVHYRTHLQDTQHTVNNAPMVDYKDSRFKWLLDDDWSRRTGAEWFRVIQETQNKYHPAFQERGQWNIPPYGKVAIRDLKPNHLTPWI